MNSIQFERVYDLSVMTYTDMQMHPAEEAAGARVVVERHLMPDDVPPMCGGGEGPAPGWPIYHDVQITTHTGTHVDGTWHFNKNGKAIYEFPLEAFMGPAVVLDMRHLPDRTPITGDDLEKAEPKIEEGDIVIINTGWHKRFGTREYGTLHPGIDGEAAEEFLLRKKIKMIGMDTICVEPGSEQDHWAHPLHRVCLIENEILLIENLGGEIDAVTGRRCYIMALPILLKADSGPARVVALA